jgi:anti-sigma factor RsiW
MNCQDVEQLLDGFVDTELSPPQLLDVARHAATCPACDGTIRELTVLRESVARLVEGEVRQLDLSGVWPAVAATIPASWARRTAVTVLPRKLPVWGAVMALAASLLLWLGTSVQPPSPPKQIASADHPANRARTWQSANHAEIDRLTGKGIAVRREPKSGTTVIWVNHTVEDANP